MNFSETLLRIVVGFVEMVPILGHLLAYFDRKFNFRKLKIIHLAAGTPYEQGLQQGKLLQEEIFDCFYKTVLIFKYLAKKQKIDPYAKAKELEKFIPPEYIEEMKGLAAGSGLAYEEILVGNTIMDVVDLFACSLCGVQKNSKTGKILRQLATNHFTSLSRKNSRNVNRSFERFDSMQNAPKGSAVQDIKTALRKANHPYTIHSTVFDTDTGDIYLAIAGKYAAKYDSTLFSRKELFLREKQELGNSTKLGYNLDFPLPYLGPYTVLIVRPKSETAFSSVSIGWGGLVGVLNAMNEKNVALGLGKVPSSRGCGIPNQIICRMVIDQAGSCKEAISLLKDLIPSSSMNIVAAAPDGIVHAELDPQRPQKMTFIDENE